MAELLIFLLFLGYRMQVPLLNALKTFTVSAQRLNFTKASEDLLVSPSAISHQIKILEEYLGCKLFLRKNRSLELTEEGLFLFNRLQRPFYEINQALSELRMPHGKSRINLSLRPFVSSMWFTKQLADLWRKHPGIEINLIHSLQAPDFFRDNINFAIVWGKQGDWPHLATLPIIAGNLTPVCSPAYLQERCKPMLYGISLGIHDCNTQHVRQHDGRVYTSS